MPGSLLKYGARRLIFDNSPRLLLISLFYVLMVTLISMLTYRLPGRINEQDILSRLASGEIPGILIIYSNFRPIGAFLACLLLFINPIINFGFLSFCVKTNRSQDTDYKDLLNGFLFFSKVFMIFLITTIYIFLWSLLLIIPGIVASYRYRQAYYILLDDPRKGVMQCIEESKAMMHGSKVDLLTIDISFIGWYVLDFLISIMMPLPFPFPIVSVWLSPYIGLTHAAFYEDRVTRVAV